jgi:hypothetical protein
MSFKRIELFANRIQELSVDVVSKEKELVDERFHVIVFPDPFDKEEQLLVRGRIKVNDQIQIL